MVTLSDDSQGLYLLEEVCHVDGFNPDTQCPVHCLLEVDVWALEQLVPEPVLICLIGGSDILVPLALKLNEILLTAPPTDLRPGYLS